MNKLEKSASKTKIKAFLALTLLCGIGVLLDIFTTQAGLKAGFIEAGNALFALEFFSLSALSVGLFDLGHVFGSKWAGIAPVLFSFVPAINNFAVMGGLK